MTYKSNSHLENIHVFPTRNNIGYTEIPPILRRENGLHSRYQTHFRNIARVSVK